MISEVNGPGIGAINAPENRSTKIDNTTRVDQSPVASNHGADVVTLTDLASRLQKLTESVADLPVADQKKIEAFRNLIADGSYHVDAHAVAEKLTSIEALLADMPDRK